MGIKRHYTLDVHRKNHYTGKQMIQSYKNKKTGSFANGEFVKDFEGFADQAKRRLSILNAATSLNDLRALPSNRFETLKGDRNGQYSVCINMQWRICFTWATDASGPSDVEIVDYH